MSVWKRNIDLRFKYSCFVILLFTIYHTCLLSKPNLCTFLNWGIWTLCPVLREMNKFLIAYRIYKQVGCVCKCKEKIREERAHGGANGWGAALREGRLRHRFLIVSLEFFRPHHDPAVDSTSKSNENQKHFLCCKGGRCIGLTALPSLYSDCLEILVPHFHERLKAPIPV